MVLSTSYFILPGQSASQSPDFVPRAGDSSYKQVQCTDITEEEGAAKKQSVGEFSQAKTVVYGTNVQSHNPGVCFREIVTAQSDLSL